MKSVLAVLAVLMSVQAADAGTIKKREGERRANSLNPYGLTLVDLKAVNCDELVHLAKKNTVIDASGFLVAGNSSNCLTLHDTRYDFFEAVGLFLTTKNSKCSVWSCEPRRDYGGGKSGS